MKANLFFGVSSTNTKQEQKDDKFIYATRQRNLFSNSIESNIDRGLNIINIQSGQKIASWIYDGPLRVENSFWRLEPSLLLRWFATTIGKFTGGNEFHPLVSPFPLGLKSNVGLREIVNSEYVISPDGKHPDCHRH